MSLTVPPLDVERTGFSSVSTYLPWVRPYVGVAPASAAWPTVNQAIAVPFLVSTPVTVNEMAYMAGTTPGTTNLDLGIYSDTWVRLASTGAVASTNTSTAPNPAGGAPLTTPVTLQRGRYYLAMSSAATTLTCFGWTTTNQTARALGVQTMASAHPLPATFVPASVGTQTLIPDIEALTLTNIL